MSADVEHNGTLFPIPPLVLEHCALMGSAVEAQESSVETTSHNLVDVDGETQPETEQIYELTIVLPPGQTPRTIKIIAPPQESPTDLRQHLISHPSTHHLTNYHFEYEGKALNEYLELSTVGDLPLEASLSIIQDNYNERTARAHFLRVKELIAPPGTGSKGLGEEWGIDPGSTLVEHVQHTSSAAPADLGEYFAQPIPSLASILAPVKDKSPSSNPVKSLQLSQWNPPPPHRRTHGDLIYLTFTSLEGDMYHITGHMTGFYVSRSTNHKFDPTPKSPQKLPTHSLVTLLESLSPQFAQAFSKLHPAEMNADILSDAPLANALPAFPWLVSVPCSSADSLRTQKPWLENLAEGQGNLRDWNDEIQSTRSLASNGVKERLIRERLLQKSLADFSACATYAAMLVRRGELLALDPIPDHEHDTEETGTMWHYNNIFLSLGGDDVLGSFEKEGGGEASRVAVGKDVVGVARINSLLLESQDDAGKSDSGLCTLGTVIVDYLGERIVAQSVVPGIFQQASENKDEDGAAAGAHRIVYGAVDNAEKIFMDKDFDERFSKLMDKVHIKRHDVWEVPKKVKEGEDPANGENQTERPKRTLCTSLETKGLRGADGRKYVLDLYKLTPLDINFIEANYTESEDSYPHRMAFLRGECVDAFWESKLRAWVSTKLAERQKSETENPDKEIEKIDVSGFDFALNPDVFTPSQAPTTEEEKQRLKQDEDDVRACCTFLQEKLIPDLMKELSDGSGGWPVDGKSLTSTMHRNGVNVRYLAKVVELSGESPKLEAVKNVALHEMVSRAAKHVFSRYLRKLPLLDVPSCVAHLLNCLVGYKLNPCPQAQSSEDEYSTTSSEPEWAQLNGVKMHQEVVKEVFKRFRFQLEEEWWTQCKPLMLLREICLKMGFQLKAREYTFEKSAVVFNGTSKPKKAVNGVDGHKPAETTFTAEDVLNVVPIVKDAPLKSALAEEALEAGKSALFQGQKELGLDLLSESLSLHEQIYGVLHPDVARGYSKLSLIYNQLDETRTAACDLARKAVIVGERTLGLDNHETILNWLNWALCEHGNGNTKEALVFILHVLSIWRNLFGEGHPDEVTMMNNVAVMLQSLREHQASLAWFEKSYTQCSHIHGKNSLNAATISFQYSQALALAQDPISAVPKMRDAYTIFAKELGPDDRSTKEAEFLLQHFTTSAVNMAKQAKLGRKVVAPNVKVNSSVKPVGPEVDGTGSRGLQNIDELVKYIGAVNFGTDAQKVRAQKKRRGGKR